MRLSHSAATIRAVTAEHQQSINAMNSWCFSKRNQYDNHLDDNAIASIQGRHQRVEHIMEWVVPRHNGANLAETQQLWM
jgi:hypothetical protein